MSMTNIQEEKLMTNNLTLLIRGLKNGEYHTQHSVEERLDQHNNHYYGKHSFTAKANDWKIYLSLEVSDFEHAMRLERKIKSMKSRVFIEKLKNDPSLREDMIQTIE